jgi:uncharacterized protein (DUF488 family)
VRLRRLNRGTEHARAPEPLHVYTVGHSTRRQEEFIQLLCRHEVTTLADVRRFPGSRRHPHFNREQLAAALPSAGVRYVHIMRLGGRRNTKPEASPNQGWRNAAFRAYADYMLTDEFEQGVRELLSLAWDGPLAIMCAEAVPWRCHRWLLSDALTVRGCVVSHIHSVERADLHELTSFARVEGPRIEYPPEQPPLRL